MKSEILEKLAKELALPITTERQAVYILVEIRKLLERERLQDDYFALNFYCCWAVHVTLTRAGARRILERLDRFQEGLEDLVAGGRKLARKFPVREVGEMVHLHKFRSELEKFLKEVGLDHSLATSDDRWVDFLRQYFAVIQDCPLACRTAGLRYVDEAYVQVIPKGRVMNPKFKLHVQWCWTSKASGKSAAFEASF